LLCYLSNFELYSFQDFQRHCYLDHPMLFSNCMMMQYVDEYECHILNEKLILFFDCFNWSRYTNINKSMKGIYLNMTRLKRNEASRIPREKKNIVLILPFELKGVIWGYMINIPLIKRHYDILYLACWKYCNFVIISLI
jgi:hypothetical protein